MHYSIGIDFGKDKLDICWLRDVRANKKKTKVFRNQRKEFEAIANWIRKNTKAEPQDVLITAEPTGVYHEACIYRQSEIFRYRAPIKKPPESGGKSTSRRG